MKARPDREPREPDLRLPASARPLCSSLPHGRAAQTLASAADMILEVGLEHGQGSDGTDERRATGLPAWREASR